MILPLRGYFGGPNEYKVDLSRMSYSCVNARTVTSICCPIH